MKTPRLFTTLLATLAFTAAAFAGALDGTTWKIAVTPDDESARKGEAAYEDTLIFAGDHVTTTEGPKHGFYAAAYTGNKRGTIFNATVPSISEGSATWSGEIKGDAVTGRISWRKKDGTRVRYSFSGKKQ